MNNFQITIIASTLFLIAGCSREAPKPPNILFIMSDDHAVNAVGSYGKRLSGLEVTPNIDKLAGEGMQFANCFVTNSICSPSRASILTGKYSHLNGVYCLNQNFQLSTYGGGRREQPGSHSAQSGPRHFYHQGVGKADPHLDLRPFGPVHPVYDGTE